jgi:hypothetical protein
MASVFEVNSAGAIGIAGANYGSANQVLLSGGSAATPSWSNVDGSVITIPSQAQGDLLYRGASTWDRLAAGTANQVLKTQGSAANPAWGDVVTRSASQTTAASGNSFTGIPSWVRQITIAVTGLETNSSSDTNFQVRLGTSSGFVSSGYLSRASWFQNDTGSGGNGSTISVTTGFGIFASTGGYEHSGNVRLTNLGGNTWVEDHVMCGVGSSPLNVFGGGVVTLSGTLDRVQVVPGSSTLRTTGSISILYS